MAAGATPCPLIFYRHVESELRRYRLGQGNRQDHFCLIYWIAVRMPHKELP